jgi:hypothetical protein
MTIDKLEKGIAEVPFAEPGDGSMAELRGSDKSNTGQAKRKEPAVSRETKSGGLRANVALDYTARHRNAGKLGEE